MGRFGGMPFGILNYHKRGITRETASLKRRYAYDRSTDGDSNI